MCCGDVDRCGARERTVSAQALIGDDAKRIDIGLRRGMLALRLLRGNVLRGAHDHAVLRDLLLIGGVGDAEVGDLHLAGIGHHDVRRLHVTVDHAMGMRDEQAACGLNENRQQLDRVHRAVLLVVQVCKRLARHVFHDEESDAVMLVIFEQRSDVRMRKIGGIMGFRAQTKQFGLLGDAQIAT